MVYLEDIYGDEPPTSLLNLFPVLDKPRLDSIGVINSAANVSSFAWNRVRLPQTQSISCCRSFKRRSKSYFGRCQPGQPL
ncbi:hypothetical protein HYQ46_004725 [Verticillium longisporum]|nr:hypothetical protein HYQ44_018376 [Verticillium longisporum]KAG7146479.1 hypothetical protein HYQ46_004725 [Verticillium longisporum]